MIKSKHLSILGLLMSICLLMSCAKQISLSDMISKKKHDEDGIYYVEFDRPQNPSKVKSELDKNGYKIKDAYYWSGLEKKTDKYKFLWFYGKEYDSLKASRKIERRRDSLLNAGDFVSYQKALTEFPELKKEDSAKKAINHLSGLSDIKLYHQKYGQDNLKDTEVKAKVWVKKPSDLLAYKQLYGISDFVENKILEMIPTSNEKEAKVLSENFPLSKHLSKVELNYLSKVQFIKDFIYTKESEKHFKVNGRFNFMDVNEVKKFADNLNLLLPSKPDGIRLSHALFDEHMKQKVLIRNKDDQYAVMDDYLAYAEGQSEWMGKDYVRSKERNMVKDLNASKYSINEFEVFYQETNKLFMSWQWKNRFSFVPETMVIESFKGSKRVVKNNDDSKSGIEKILFEEVENKVFVELEEDFNLDDFSYIRLYGQYKMKSSEEVRLPFHIIFELDKKSKSYKIPEFIITNHGTDVTYYDGKNEGSSFYYDKQSKKLIRRGK